MSWFKRAFGPSALRKKNRDRATKLVTEGFVHAKEGRLDNARKSYEAALAADETFAVAHLNLGLCRLDLFNRDVASLDIDARAEALDVIASTLERALSLDDTPWMGWRALANVEERRLAFASAEDAWKRVDDKAPPDSEAKREARAAVAKLAKKAAAERARRRALSALEADVDAAERTAALAELLPFLDDAHAAELSAVLPRGHALAGTLARRAGDRVRAREWLEKATATRAGDSDVDVEALRELASVCIEDGDLQRALSASIAAYREKPGDAGLVCNVGVCHLGLGDVEKAAEYIDLAWRLEPKDPIVQRARDALTKAQRG